MVEISHPCLVDSEYLTMCRPWWSSSRKSHLVDQKQKTFGVYSHRCRSEKKKGECSSSLVTGCRNCTPDELAAIRK